MSNEREVLLTIGNVRIREYDSMNVQIERLEEYTSIQPVNEGKQRKRVMKKDWRFKGYSSSILDALEAINRKELLIDKKLASDLESYVKQVKESNEKILEEVKWMIQSSNT